MIQEKFVKIIYGQKLKGKKSHSRRKNILGKHACCNSDPGLYLAFIKNTMVAEEG